jgi:hypothetical protein
MFLLTPCTAAELRSYKYHELVGLSMGSACTDIRDKLYRLVGLLDGIARPVVDYSKTVESTIITAVELILKEWVVFGNRSKWTLLARLALYFRLGDIMLPQLEWPALESHELSRTTGELVDRIWPSPPRGQRSPNVA